MANLLEPCAKLCIFGCAEASLHTARDLQNQLLTNIAIWRGNCFRYEREVVKAFGGVLNGLDGTFVPESKGPKPERQTLTSSGVFHLASVCHSEAPPTGAAALGTNL